MAISRTRPRVVPAFGRLFRPAFVTLATALCLGAQTHAAPDFLKEVRPILERSCFGCHGPEKQKNGYRLDVREEAIKGGDSGEPAILPHNAKRSPLIRYVSGEDEEKQMPPKKSKAPQLSAAEIETLKAWIDAGPAWPEDAGSKVAAAPHWSLQPLAKPPVPAGSAHPIDAFVRAKLAEKVLQPSPEADRRTLLRRVTYDLTGLPPTPEEVEAFARDTDPRAYEKTVDRLLASPRYGERWARHWLDTVHFADSHGYEHDVGRPNAWRYRDYVIGAFNADTTWARFIREQLAADVFFPEETRLTPALGFLGAGTQDLSTQGTAPITFDYLDRDDLVTQTMAAFTSTTANCARCHAHKFDPISQEDYYALQAVFSGVLKGDVPYDEDNNVARERRHWTAVVAAADRKDAAVLLAPENAAPISTWLTQNAAAARWQTLIPETFISAEGSTLNRTADGVLLVNGPRPERDVYTVTATTTLTKLTALRLNLLAHDSLPMHGPGRNDNGNLHLSEIEMLAFEPGVPKARMVKFRRATADFNQEGWGIERALDGDMKTAWGIFPAVGKAHFGVFELAEPLTLAPGTRLSVILRQAHGGGHLIGALSLAVTDDDPAKAIALPAAVETVLAVPATKRTPAQNLEIAAYALRLIAQDTLAKLPPQARVFAAAATVEMVGGEATNPVRSLPEPKVVNLLQRGDFDKPRAIMEPGALTALKHLPARFVLANPKSESARRAAMADWLAHPDNVLTWRSIVNRVWHYHFGRGLCDTPSDFGKMGGTPSNVELLNWLAVWFRDDAKGSLKDLHKLIVTSATYRQASQQRADAAKIDGDDRFLWRQERQRLDADGFRDFALATAGTLDLTMGGPGVQHFSQRKGPQSTPVLDYTAYDWTRPDARRRSIYAFIWRGIADPFMEALDFPDLGLLSPTRGFSASSLQALTLYNNDFVLQASMALAARAEKEAPTLDAQVTRVVRLMWLRGPTVEEQRDFAEFAKARGLPALCRLLLNSNEFLFID
jgi:mono/diheme cytochrome c family protein